MTADAPSPVVSRWQRYWFAEGGRYAAAVLRISIAISVLLSLWRLSTLDRLVAPESVYRPVGIWMVLGRTAPPELVVDLLWMLAWTGALAMLAGFCARAATAVSFGAGVALAALSYSGSLSWSHQYNVVFVAQLAFLGARGGDALSIDAWLRRRRGLPPLDVPRGYQWSVRLVLLSVSLMFIGAALHKLGSGQFTLRWALSDNLRHQLMVRYDLSGSERPAFVDWLLADVWRYRTTAVLNLISQAAPLTAIIFVRHPLVRAAAGGFFVLEVLALGFVTSLWNLHWLPLAAVFVDWDRLIAAIRARTGRPVPPPAPAPEGWRPPRRRRAFLACFVVYELAMSLIPLIDQKLNTFPFSSFPMFASIRAARPYDQHLPYTAVGDSYELISDHPVPKHVQRWLDFGNRNLHTVRDPATLKGRLAAVLLRAQERYPSLGIRGLRHHLVFFVAPAYPAPAEFERHRIAITGELYTDGTYRSMLGRLTGSGVTLGPDGLDPAGAHLVYFADDQPVPIELGGSRTGNAVAVAIEADPVYVVAELGGQRWLVASKRTWRW